MNQYDYLRLALVSGKGGVGKTTLACGFARRWAKQFPQEKVLLVSTDPAHSLGDVLQMSVTDAPQAVADLPNLSVRALEADVLLQAFKERYGSVLEQLVERGSFVQGEDLTPVWDLGWPGLDELMAILEIQQLLRSQTVDRIVVDMAPSGHTLNLFHLMDFLDGFLAALELFQEKHRVISQSFTGRYTPDEADAFLQSMTAELSAGRQLLQDPSHTACLVVAIAEPMSLLETQRFLEALAQLNVPHGGLLINRILSSTTESTAPCAQTLDRYSEQQALLQQFLQLAQQFQLSNLFTVPEQPQDPIGAIALDTLVSQIYPIKTVDPAPPPAIEWPSKILPSFSDFVSEGRQLILVGGKGGVGKTTIAAAIAWKMAQHCDRNIRVISIDPAHSLGDAFGQPLGHQPTWISSNLSGQEIDANLVLEQFRADYLWELAEMMSGDTGDAAQTMSIAYGPEAWRRIVSQALPGIDEMLSLVAVIELLERKEQDLIILDTAPTGHLLRFLEMPTALADWLAWIFKLWIKYQDVLGRTELMSRLRNLRQRVVKAQKQLTDPAFTEFILVLQAQSAIVAEAQRLTRSLQQMNVPHRYTVLNRFASEDLPADAFPGQTLIHLPNLPRSIPASDRISGAADLLF